MANRAFRPVLAEVLENASLRMILIFPFVLLIAATVGLVGYLSFRNGQKAVNDLASQLRSELTGRIQQHLQGYVEAPHIINRLNASNLRQGSLNVSQTQGGHQFFQQIKLIPAVNAVYCGTTGGEFFGVSREENNSTFEEHTFQIMMSNRSTEYVMQLFAIDSSGNPTYFLDKVRPYDPRIRPWYQTAIGVNKPTWSPVYLDFTSLLPTVTASLPVYNRVGNSLIGVCGADVVLSEELRNFLKSLEIGRSGETFIIERSGTLISSSTDEKLTVGEGDQAKRLMASESSNPLIQSTADYLSDRFQDLNAIQSPQQLDFELHGQRQFLEVLPFNDVYGLDWLIVVVVPEADFMEEIYSNTYRTIGLCLAALAIASGLGILIARWISRPVLELSQASTRIARGDLNPRVAVDKIQELRTLAHSFNTMGQQLQESFTTLEARNAALKIAEENYRSIFENALEGIFQSTLDGHYMRVNPAMARIYGYGSPEEMIANITHIETQIYVNPVGRAEFQRLMHHHGEIKNLEYQIYRKDGAIVWVEEDTRVVRDATGQPIYYEGIVQDISDRKQKEEELKRQLQELQISIDHQQREDEVKQITKSDYFQQLRAEIERLRLKSDF